MPGDDIEGRVVLFACEVFAAEFMDNFQVTKISQSSVGMLIDELTIPRSLIDVEVRDRVLKVTDVSKSVGTQRPQLWQLVMRAEDFLDVCVNVSC